MRSYDYNTFFTGGMKSSGEYGVSAKQKKKVFSNRDRHFSTSLPDLLKSEYRFLWNIA